MAKPRILVTGATGRLGRLLGHVWGRDGAVFLGRDRWDILCQPSPSMGPGDVVLDLAGCIRGEVSQNAEIARHVARAAALAGAGLAYMSSAAVYRGGTDDMREGDDPAPGTAYGFSKVEAEAAVLASHPRPLILRLGNVAGADSLLGGLQAGVPARLDPVRGSLGGPIRSYIGPLTLAKCLSALLAKVAAEASLPTILNLAQPGPVTMAGLLQAAGHDFHFGPERAGVLDRMGLDTGLLQSVMPVLPASPEGLVAEWRGMGGWP